MTVLAFIARIFQANGQDTEKLLKKYIEFYYPTTAAAYYDIVFEWGNYGITTGEPLEAEVHPDSERYRGYIGMRPAPLTNADGTPLATYLITPDGKVWMCYESEVEIAPHNKRDEVVQEGNATSTTIIQSPLEPLVDHFSAYPEKWKAFGNLVASGKKYKLRTEK